MSLRGRDRILLAEDDVGGPVSTNRTGRPRDAARHDAILAATRHLLSEVGYDRLTMESVATRCGAGKNTIYRRWPDKAALVAAAVASTHRMTADIDTGSLRDDLIQHAAEWHVSDGQRDAVVAGLLAAMRHHPELRAAVGGEITGPGRATFRRVVERAVRRGEIADGLNIEIIGMALPAMVFHHLAVLDVAVDRDVIASIVDDLVLPALRADASSSGLGIAVEVSQRRKEDGDRTQHEHR